MGKTYHMLNDANLLREQGVDVVIGLIESHGRKETEAQIRDLEIVPLRVDSLPHGEAAGDGCRGDSGAASAYGDGR